MRIFNPSHDECLASNSPFYTPSRVAQEMDNARPPKGWTRLCDVSGNWEGVDEITPWGWDARIVHQLRKRGCPERLLPSEETVKRIRELSSRETAVKLLKTVREDVKDGTIGESWFCKTEEEVEEVLFSSSREMLFKQPWSCSGRGLFKDAKRLDKTLRTQGGVAIEPYYDVLANFAMEFSCENGTCVFDSYSAFLTDADGRYQGNLVLPDEEIEKLMTKYVKKEIVENVRQSLTHNLQRAIAPYYNGPLGVDMMIVKEEGRLYLHPCVEINLRWTMGRVAALYAKSGH